MYPYQRFAKETDMTIYRQGDVMLRLRGRKPVKLVDAPRDEHGRVVLAHGERTGHAHALRGQTVTAFFKETPERDMGFSTPDYLVVGGSGASLRHEHVSGAKAEHDAIALAPGAYDVLVPVEHTDEDEPLRVAD
jgi:hypothetical protein